MKLFFFTLICLGLSSANSDTTAVLLGRLLFYVSEDVCLERTDNAIFSSLDQIFEILKNEDMFQNKGGALEHFKYLIADAKHAKVMRDFFEGMKEKLRTAKENGNLGQGSGSMTLLQLLQDLEAKTSAERDDVLDNLLADLTTFHNFTGAENEILGLTVKEFQEKCVPDLLKIYFGSHIIDLIKNDVKDLIDFMSRHMAELPDLDLIFKLREKALTVLCGLFGKNGNPWHNIILLEEQIAVDLKHDIFDIFSVKRKRRSTKFTRREWLKKVMAEINSLEKRQGPPSSASPPSPTTTTTTTTTPPPSPTTTTTSTTGSQQSAYLRNQVENAIDIYQRKVEVLEELLYRITQMFLHAYFGGDVMIYWVHYEDELKIAWELCVESPQTGNQIRSFNH